MYLPRPGYFGYYNDNLQSICSGASMLLVDSSGLLMDNVFILLQKIQCFYWILKESNVYHIAGTGGFCKHQIDAGAGRHRIGLIRDLGNTV